VHFAALPEHNMITMIETMAKNIFLLGAEKNLAALLDHKKRLTDSPLSLGIGLMVQENEAYKDAKL
jgi:hypothetical protein